MIGIGSFAQLAKVSVRTLRHYDDVGLLRPVSVDSSTGYRSYAAAQLPQLNRILALKDLGFSLAEITRMVESGVSRDELLGMLKLRQAEAQRAAADERKRLARVAARIDSLTGELTMSTTNTNLDALDTAVVIKPIDGVRLAITVEAADGFDADFSPIFHRLYPRLFAALARAGIEPAGPTYGLYDERDDGRIDVIAGVMVAPGSEIDDKHVSMRDLPPVKRAATLVHRGAMTGVADSFDALVRWIDQASEEAVGFGREVYLECPDDDYDAWVTELQFVLR